jgi:hypothetical protein
VSSCSLKGVVGSRFEDLVVYRRAVALADEMRDAVVGWESVDVWTCGVQAIRAADSISEGTKRTQEIGRMVNGLIRGLTRSSARAKRT